MVELAPSSQTEHDKKDHNEARGGRHRRKRLGGSVMAIISRRRFEGAHRGGRHEARYQVPDASQDNFSRDPFTANRHIETSRSAVTPEVPAGPAIEAFASPPALAVEQPAIDTESGEAYVPAASNIRPEIPTGRHDTGEQAIVEPGYEARHASPVDTDQEWYATNEHRLIEPQGDIVGQSFEVPVATHEETNDRNVIGSREWQLDQDGRVRATETGTDSDPNVIGSATWRNKREAALPTLEPGAEYKADDDENIVGSPAWQRRKDAMLNAHRDHTYGSEPKQIDRPIAEAAPPAQVENNNVLARVYNNLRSHRRNQGRHAAVGNGGRFSFLSRGKGRHRA